MIDVLASDLQDYYEEGGFCRVIVQGTLHDEGNHEPGWHRKSNRYLRVSMSMERNEDFDEELRRRLGERAHAPINGFITCDHERRGDQ